jgi:hypothetical protein
MKDLVGLISVSDLGSDHERDNLLIRLLSKVSVNKETGCWEWTAAREVRGYGMLARGWKQRPYKAHRLSYELFVGAIPEGLVIRHKCDNPCCINPKHLEPGTQKDNSKDASTRGRLNQKSLLNLHPGCKGHLGAGPKSVQEIKHGQGR